MQFHNHETLWESLRNNPEINLHYKSHERFYEEICDAMIVKGEAQIDENTLSQMCIDKCWYSETRPYYKVWPSFAEALSKVTLDVQVQSLEVPDMTVCIRFACGREPQVNGAKLQSIMVARDVPFCLETKKEGPPLILVWPTIVFEGEKYGGTVWAFMAGDPMTIDERIKEFKILHDDEVAKAFRLSVRFSIATLLLAKDESYIEPEVLSADQEKYQKTNDPKYIDKARRRGVVGWSIGREFESCPHFRRPHFALYHTGKGRSIPKILPVKGTIVHRSKMTQVPTGHIMPNGQEVEV